MNKNKNDLKSINATLSHKRVENNGKLFDNLIVTTPNGTKFEVKLSFFNKKLLYKIICEIEGKNNG